MPTREQKLQAARLRGEARQAVANSIRCGGGDAALTADEVLRQIELRYTLVPKTPADARCPAHPGIALVGGVCPACGPQLDDDGGDPWA